MSTETLQFLFRVGSGAVLTNATSVTLSDPTGTYGVKRSDTGDILVADGTAMTTSQTGVYRYSFTADPGTPITWWAEAIYNGVTYRFQRDSTTAVSTPTGYYGGLADVYAIAGETLFNSYSQLEESSTGLDSDRTQVGMNQVDADISDFLRQNGVTSPASPSNPSFLKLTQAFGYRVTAWAYRSKGELGTDASGAPDYAKYNAWMKTANTLMREYVIGQRQNISGQVAFASGNAWPGNWSNCG